MKRCALFIVMLALATQSFAIGTDSSSPKLKIPPDAAEKNALHRVRPVYPEMAQIAHIQGDVVLQAIITKEGKVGSLKAVSGHPLLIQSALDAVKKWTYKPFFKNGEPVEVETTVTIHFHQ